MICLAVSSLKVIEVRKFCVATLPCTVLHPGTLSIMWVAMALVEMSVHRSYDHRHLPGFRFSAVVFHYYILNSTPNLYLMEKKKDEPIAPTIQLLGTSSWGSMDPQLSSGAKDFGPHWIHASPKTCHGLWSRWRQSKSTSAFATCQQVNVSGLEEFRRQGLTCPRNFLKSEAQNRRSLSPLSPVVCPLPNGWVGESSQSPLSLSSHPTTPSVFTLPFSLLSLSLSLVWTRRRPRSISPYRYGRGFFEHRERRAVGRFSLKIDLRCSSTAWISLSSSSLLLPGLCCYRSLWFLQFLTRFSTGLWNSGEAHNAVIVPWTLMQCCGA